MRLTLDTALHTRWENVIFQKTTHYSPRIQEFRTKLDTLTHRITSTYPLPNDSLITSQLFHLDLEGKLIWKKDIHENDYTRTFDFASDATGVYYCGATGNGILRHPVVRHYRLAVLGHISPDGKTESHLRYGEFSNGEWYTFNKVIPGDSIITVYGFHETEGILNKAFIQQKLIFRKRELKQKSK